MFKGRTAHPETDSDTDSISGEHLCGVSSVAEMDRKLCTNWIPPTKDLDTVMVVSHVGNVTSDFVPAYSRISSVEATSHIERRANI